MKTIAITKYCIDCETPIHKDSKRCQSCYHKSRIGSIPWWKKRNVPGPLVGKGNRFKKGELMGKNNPYWRGDKIAYSGLHGWIKKQLGQPDTCEFCGKSGLSGRKIHWASKSREYKRDLSDWLRLCASCHFQYDGSALKGWKTRRLSQ